MIYEIILFKYKRIVRIEKGKDLLNLIRKINKNC
jgi:hypothetical protein